VYFVENFLAVGMLDVAFWFQVMLYEVKIDGANDSATDPKLPGNIACWLRSRKNRSTMFIHEALVGVKCK
jgi:hypothetical protein